MLRFLIMGGLALGAAGLFGNYVAGSSKQTQTSAPAPAAAKAVPNASPRADARIVSIGRDQRGHFQANGKIDGRSVSFMVDTGASVIALTERDAGRLGIRPSSGSYTAAVQTANGVVRAAPVTLNIVDIGGLVVRDVRALVVPGGALNENLLGLSYLTRLKRFEYSNNKLVLEN